MKEYRAWDKISQRLVNLLSIDFVNEEITVETRDDKRDSYRLSFKDSAVENFPL